MTDVLLYSTVYETDVGGAVQPVPQFFLLDLIGTTPTAAFSTRKLRNAYAGSALRVRRSSDNTEQDIGFSGSGGLDLASLNTFVGANNGFVSKWYDQSGSGNDIAEATAGKQPQLVASGSVIMVNGNPALLGIAANNTALTTGAFASAIWSVSAWTNLLGVRWVSFSASANPEIGGQIVGDQSGNLNFGSTNGVNVVVNSFDGVDRTVTFSPSTGTSYVFLGKLGAGTLSGWLNGGSPGTSSSGNNAGFGVFNVLGREGSAGAGFYHDGYLTECLCFNVALSSADLNTLGNGVNIAQGSMSAYVGSGWSTIP
jgi:hypothetical protein